MQNSDWLNQLSSNDPVMIAAVQSLLMEQKAGRLLWHQTPKQKTLVQTPAFETLFGGAKGGGKTFSLLGLARNYHRRCLILRRTFTELEQSVIDKSKEYFKTPEWYNNTKYTWRFPDGCLIRFGHLDGPEAASGYDGAEYDFIGFDQLEQITAPTYLHLLTVARSPDKNQRVRIVSTANPFGDNIDWIIERWANWVDDQSADPALPGEVRWFATLDNRERQVENGTPFRHKNELIIPRSRTYIPALPLDNPYLPQEYIGSLQNMPEPFRSQALYGLWKVGSTDDPHQLFPRKWVFDAMARWQPRSGRYSSVGMDIARGGEDQTVLAKRINNWFDVLEVHPGIETPTGKESAQLMMLAMMNADIGVVDVIGWGSSAYDILSQTRLSIVPFNASKSAEDYLDKSGQWGFRNLRALSNWKFREALDPDSNLNIELPKDSELLTEMSSMRWDFSGEKIIVEPKEDIKKRIGRSPDRADAITICWSQGEGNDGFNPPAALSFKSVREYSIGVD